MRKNETISEKVSFLLEAEIGNGSWWLEAGKVLESQENDRPDDRHGSGNLYSCRPSDRSH